MRSMLVVLGHPLYSEVSSDQPPLFTQILALLLRGVGFEVNPARVLVLLFSSLVGLVLCSVSADYLGETGCHPVFAAGHHGAEIPGSECIGDDWSTLHCSGCCALLFLAFWHQNKRNLWLVLSGFALALSMLIKLFTGFFVPIFLIGILR